MKLLRSGIATGVVLTAMTACATAPDPAPDPDGRVCINTNAVRAFDALSDRHVYVREARDRHYLLTMRHRCTDLGHAAGIAIRDTTATVCSKGFGEILYRDELASRRVESCRIDTIEKVADKKQAKSLVEARIEAARAKP